LDDVAGIKDDKRELSMKGDFSRSTFDPHKHYTSVRMQQGRVQLDADWNEQADILLHLITTQLKDLLGLGGTMVINPGFIITLDKSESQPLDEDQVNLPDEDEMGRPQDTTQPTRIMPDFKIGAGCYYVDGILCENLADVLFSQQPDYPAAATLAKKPVNQDHYLVYLDVWQRHITAVTTTRVKTVWQVKLLPISGDLVDYQGSHDGGNLRLLPEWQEFVKQNGIRGRLRARWDKEKGGFLENRLYRVEIHSVAGDEVTFKWSRENGSVVFPISEIIIPDQEQRSQGVQDAKEDNLERDIYQLKVENLERDISQLKDKDWVELVDDATILNSRPLPLCQVKVDRPNALVTLEGEKDKIDQIRKEFSEQLSNHPLLRLWEDDAKPIPTQKEPEKWLDLKNGIQVAFSDTVSYQVGDYWLIPARTGSENGIEWPQTHDGEPLARAPHGSVHHYAPLGLLQYAERSWCVIPDDAARFATLPQVETHLKLVDDVLRKPETNLARHDNRVTDLEERLAGVDDRLDKHDDYFARLGNRVTVLEEQQADFQAPLVQYFQMADEINIGHVVSVIPVDPSDEPDSELRVRLANKENESDRRLVVGVVKDVFMEGDERKYCRVVLYGRAQCRVVGEIEPGDVLLPSEKPGYAQKAGLFAWPGTIIGKALSTIKFDMEVMEQIDEGIQPAQIEMPERTGTVDMIVTLR
jgi:hypothetical protein